MGAFLWFFREGCCRSRDGRHGGHAQSREDLTSIARFVCLFPGLCIRRQGLRGFCRPALACARRNGRGAGELETLYLPSDLLCLSSDLEACGEDGQTLLGQRLGYRLFLEQAREPGAHQRGESAARNGDDPVTPLLPSSELQIAVKRAPLGVSERIAGRRDLLELRFRRAVFRIEIGMAGLRGLPERARNRLLVRVGLRSGWQAFAASRNALAIVFSSASGATPSTS
jgi:hypothetical protein